MKRGKDDTCLTLVALIRARRDTKIVEVGVDEGNVIRMVCGRARGERRRKRGTQIAIIYECQMCIG